MTGVSRRIRMLRTVEATIDQNGKVELAESVKLDGKRRALVTILDEWTDAETPHDTALLAESALAKEWLDEDEDKAWRHLAELPDLDKSSKGRNGKKGRR
jgi:hypothetical protein